MMIEDTSKMLKRVQGEASLSEILEWRKWQNEIPYLNFPQEFKVKVIPPFEGAVVRFVVADETEKVSVSVYLDCYGILGCMDEPYWEIYPYEDDVYRVFLNETDELMLRIKESIQQQLSK